MGRPQCADAARVHRAGQCRRGGRPRQRRRREARRHLGRSRGQRDDRPPARHRQRSTHHRVDVSCRQRRGRARRGARRRYRRHARRRRRPRRGVVEQPRWGPVHCLRRCRGTGHHHLGRRDRWRAHPRRDGDRHMRCIRIRRDRGVPTGRLSLRQPRPVHLGHGWPRDLRLGQRLGRADECLRHLPGRKRLPDHQHHGRPGQAGVLLLRQRRNRCRRLCDHGSRYRAGDVVHGAVGRMPGLRRGRCVR